MNHRSLLQHLGKIGLCIVSTAAIAYPTVYPTGTTIYDPDEAHGSYILISDHADRGNHPSAAVRAKSEIPDDIRLIDMNGNVVHAWTVAPYFNKRSRLLPNGNLLYAGPDNTIIEYDWDSKVVWQHQGIGSVNDLRIPRTLSAAHRSTSRRAATTLRASATCTRRTASSNEPIAIPKPFHVSRSAAVVPRPNHSRACFVIPPSHTGSAAAKPPAGRRRWHSEVSGDRKVPLEATTPAGKCRM